MDLLDRSNSSELLGIVHELLAPGGEMVFYESNPWNPVHKLRAHVPAIGWEKKIRETFSIDQVFTSCFPNSGSFGFMRFSTICFCPADSSFDLVSSQPLDPARERADHPHDGRFNPDPCAKTAPRGKNCLTSRFSRMNRFADALSVVIPSHNEEMNIGPLVERILTLYGEYVHEIIPVNDGSTDRTGEVMTELAAKDDRVKPLHRVPPNGVGLAIADGLSAASGQYVLTMDCDFQHLLPEFRDLLDAAAEGYDVVIGSRFSRHSVLLNYPFLKILANRAFHAIAVVAVRATDSRRNQQFENHAT